MDEMVILLQKYSMHGRTSFCFFSRRTEFGMTNTAVIHVSEDKRKTMSYL